MEFHMDYLYLCVYHTPGVNMTTDLLTFHLPDSLYPGDVLFILETVFNQKSKLDSFSFETLIFGLRKMGV